VLAVDRHDPSRRPAGSLALGCEVRRVIQGLKKRRDIFMLLLSSTFSIIE